MAKATTAKKPELKKKPVAKKPAVKKPEKAKKILANVPEEYVFWCHDGGIYHNLMELRDALQMMADDTYCYHVNAEKNDFMNWVRDVIEDEELADELFHAANRGEAANQVNVRIITLAE